ncbi:hypothetical protein [Kibdelosporangium philippinense]|uniref:hypothetical protein n=1 Tax=Kibdelosporangium philippinense TaxID=211113 RepID=UPI00361643E5
MELLALTGNNSQATTSQSTHQAAAISAVRHGWFNVRYPIRRKHLATTGNVPV